MIPAPSSQQDSRHSICFLLSGQNPSVIQEADPIPSSSPLSWTSASTDTENTPRPACDVPAPPLPTPGVPTSQTKELTPPTTGGRLGTGSLSPSTAPQDLAPQDLNQGEAPAIPTPFLTGQHDGELVPVSHPQLIPQPAGFSPSVITIQSQICLPDSISRTDEPWLLEIMEPANARNVTYVQFNSVLKDLNKEIIQRIEFIPTRSDPRIPGISMLQILQAADVIVDGDQAVDIDSDSVNLQYEGHHEMVQLRCSHISITTHGLAYLMSTLIYRHLKAENTQVDFYSIRNVSNAYLVSIYSEEPGIWIPEIAFVLFS